MSVLQELRSRFSSILNSLVPDVPGLLDLIRPSQDGRFGDYQVNCAMPLEKRLGRPARQIAQELLDGAHLNDLATAEIAGPGFINLTLRDDWIKEHLKRALVDPRLGVGLTETPRRFVIDFSSPNVAKPMHVGHIRSTVIGDALTRILRFAGHEVISDNHLGDWGTQFGMIIIGYRHWVDADRYRQQPIEELGRLYRFVRQISDYQEAVRQLPDAQGQLNQLVAARDRLRSAAPPDNKAEAKKLRKDLAAIDVKIDVQKERITEFEGRRKAAESNAKLLEASRQHPDIDSEVLNATAKLHAGDPDCLQLWNEFLPHCRRDIQRIYQRLDVQFDHELGESFYHEQLGGVVESLLQRGLARESEGAICVFLDGFDTPMIVRKKDGAYLYSTSDLATIEYRVKTWNPDAILYVVDHRQHEHFEKLFAAARKWGFQQIELQHISFGTVLGSDGKPFKTRAGDTVGLDGLLDEAVEKAMGVLRGSNAEFDDATQRQIAEVVGIGALKYADLSQNRVSDYKFSYEKMLALNGNTATYLQYLYARVNGIFAKGGIDRSKLSRGAVEFDLANPVERQLGVKLLRFGDAIDEVLVDYKPNQLTNYLFELTQTFFEFYEKCKILEAESDTLRKSRLQLSELAGRTIRVGLGLLGISVVEQM